MNPRTIIARFDSKDTYAQSHEHSDVLVIGLNNPQESEKLFSSSVFDVLNEHKVHLDHVLVDLINFATIVYTCDQIVSRVTDGYMGWSRHFVLHFPVANLKIWNKSKEQWEQLLSYLSGDKWELKFRERVANAIKAPQSAQTAPDNIVLFSGGMDSLIGAIDQLESNAATYLVSHYKGGAESSPQEALASELKKTYGGTKLKHLQFYIQPKQNHDQASKENTSRARSFLFLTLGIILANSSGARTRLVVPENGLISLNVPLTLTRIGSHSTRTTHPHFLHSLQMALNVIGINNPIENPYQFLTKGEMIIKVKNRKLFDLLYPKSMSCAHPDTGRWIAGGKAISHCGNCVPCIIRRAATKAAGLKDRDYRTNVTKRVTNPNDFGPDYNAFKIALAKIGKMDDNELAFHILKSGPLPTTSKSEYQEFVNLYKRGMNEVKNLFA